MKSRQLFVLSFLGFLLCSCKFECSIGKDSTTDSKKEKENTSAKVLNNIEIHTKDVRVNQAYLSFLNGLLVPADNTVKLGEKIVLYINCDGWKEVDGKTFLGATEEIVTDNGTEILKTDDLFAAYDATGVDAGDAKMITLNARITEQTEGIKYYITKFRVWDKKGSGEITGNYKFYVK